MAVVIVSARADIGRCGRAAICGLDRAPRAEAMRIVAGAFDFVTKPFDAGDLRAVVQKAVNTARAEFDLIEPDEALESRSAEGAFGMIGRSAAMNEVYNILDKGASI